MDSPVRRQTLSPKQCLDLQTALLSIPSALTLSIILLLLSPILQTLSKATTSDSIWPLAGSLFFLNAILADYSASNASTTGWEARLSFSCCTYAQSFRSTPSSLSLNAAVCASAVLSSRLSTHLDVFALMLFSIQCFALLPLLRAQIQVWDHMAWFYATYAVSSILTPRSRLNSERLRRRGMQASLCCLPWLR